METQHLLYASSPLNEWLTYLETLHSQAIDLGLDRVRQVASKLALLKPAPFVFTVGGTNGKGTTCRVLETLLIASGYRVGVYSSPHLLRYTERVRIQGEELSEAEHTASLDFLNRYRGEISLTYFEFSTLSALDLFKKAELDVVILEVGLGGRLDATNVVDSDVAVITSIALDHTDWLGNDREAIGREKAGIFRQGKPAIVGDPEIPESIVRVAADKHAVLQNRGQHWSFTANAAGWDFEDIQGKLNQLPLTQIPLTNAATALAALRVSGLNVDEACLREQLPLATLPGRFQTVAYSPRIILDVAHNPHAAQYLAGRIAQLSPQGKVMAVTAMLHDKDIAGTLQALAPQIDRWYIAPIHGPRGATVEDIKKILPESQSFATVELAWRAAVAEAQPDDILLVCGSFLTVAQVMQLIDAEKYHGE